MKTNKIYLGDSLEVIKTFPDESVDCVVTSPPYYGLRDYGTGEWVGGDPKCPHYRTSKVTEKTSTGHKGMAEKGAGAGDAIYKHVCPKCGAVRVDKQIGLEESPEEYIERLVVLFREIRRVLKKDGTCWVNIGDSYNGYKGNSKAEHNDSDYVGGHGGHPTREGGYGLEAKGLKNKDLIGIPWMLAFAMRADGWYLRQDIIFHKLNPMPESVTDRCTKSHEYIFLFSKNEKYYFDNEAIMEECADQERTNYQSGSRTFGVNADRNDNDLGERSKKWQPRKIGDIAVRNKRDVWSVQLRPTKEAHFATYPQKLISPCILAGCRKGGIVLDPFMGSGTTGIVARKLGRKYVGVELNPEYLKMAERRIAQEGDNLFSDI